jgi:hypothetical protein
LSKVLNRGVQAVARGAARFLSQVLDRCSQAIARGAARYLSQVLDRGANAVDRDAATPSQREKSNFSRYTAEQSKFYRLYLHCGKVTLAAVNL